MININHKIKSQIGEKMNKESSFNSTFLKIIPIVGISLIAILNYSNALNIESVLKILVIVSSISAILVVLENSKNSDTTSLLLNFSLMQVFWFAVYPFHFLLKEEREKKGQYALVAAFLSFVLIIGAGEMHRYGLLNSSDEYLSKLTNTALGFISIIAVSGAPILISNALNSVKKSLSVIFALASFITLAGVNMLSVKSEVVAAGYLVSFIFYILALRMSFYKQE